MVDDMFKRVMAYCIDMMLVSIVVNSIASSSVVNFQYDKYTKFYNNYLDLYNDYYVQLDNSEAIKDVKECDDFAKAIDEKKFVDEIYVSKYEKINKLHNKSEMSSEEYESSCLEIVKEYNENKISEEEYSEKINYYFYHLERNSTFTYLLNIIICLLYFVLFQGFTGGQTLGKKIMRLKIISTDDNELSYKKLFVRSIFLFSIIYYFICAISCFVIPLNLYTVFSNCLYLLNSVLSLSIIFTIIFTKERKGVHDMIAKTKVVQLDFLNNIKDDVINDKIDNKKDNKKNNKNNDNDNKVNKRYKKEKK